MPMLNDRIKPSKWGIIVKIIKDLNQEIISRDSDTIKFKNKISINLLIEKLSKYKIDKLLIEEASLEDIFLHYYK